MVATTLFKRTALNSSICVPRADRLLIELTRVSTSIEPPRAVRLTLSAVIFTAAGFAEKTSRFELRSVIEAAALTTTSPSDASSPEASLSVPIFTSSIAMFPAAVVSEMPFV